MSFIKLDCGVLDSSLWPDREAREIFITALLMAVPYEVKEPTSQIKVRTIEETGFVIPPGDYGLIKAAGMGIVHRSGMPMDAGLSALERLGNEDPESRSSAWAGRRLVRINGGYLALNYDKYRQKDQTAADRSRRYRERVSSRVISRGVTQVEGEVEVEGKKGEREAIPPRPLPEPIIDPSEQDITSGPARTLKPGTKPRLGIMHLHNIPSIVKKSEDLATWVACVNVVGVEVLTAAAQQVAESGGKGWASVVCPIAYALHAKANKPAPRPIEEIPDDLSTLPVGHPLRPKGIK